RVGRSRHRAAMVGERSLSRRAIYPAVVVTAFVGGYPAGLLSAVLAGLSQWYFFIPQYHWLAVLSYLVDAVVCVLLIEYVNGGLEKELHRAVVWVIFSQFRSP